MSCAHRALVLLVTKYRKQQQQKPTNLVWNTEYLSIYGKENGKIMKLKKRTT